MNRTGTNVFVLLLATLAAPAIAPGDATGHEEVPDIEIISAVMGGSGCPDETARFTLSADKRKLSVKLDDYPAHADGYASCNIAVLLSVPAGVTIALVDIDYRGYARIPDLDGSKARLRAEYFFAGGTGPVGKHTFLVDSRVITRSGPMLSARSGRPARSRCSLAPTPASGVGRGLARHHRRDHGLPRLGPLLSNSFIDRSRGRSEEHGNDRNTREDAAPAFRGPAH